MLQSELLRGSAKPTDDQSRIPFSKRKRSISTRFLRVTVPFHCSFNRSVCQQLREDVKRMGISISRDTLRLPVLSTLDGRDIRITPDKLVEEMDNVFSLLIDLQAIHPVNWPLVTKRIVSAQTSHILAFGPGGSSNIASLTSNLVNGCGIRVLLCTAKSLHSVGPRVGDGTLTPADIFRRHPQNRLQSIAAALTVRDEADTLVVPPVMDWRHRFSPRLVRMKSSSVAKQWSIVSKWTRMLGTPPIMVAGMTPTSSYYGLDLVAAVCNAGYWGELAGGGLPRRAIFQERVDTLCSKLSPGVGFHLNILYLNQKQWKFQFPMALQMRKQGYPILSLIIAAGVPSLEKCTEIISKMIDAGMECVSFKPGSVASIKRVVEIARTFPNFKVVLQWSGGRAGGHHSFEDMHQPILKTYDIIRQQSNMILVAGSGFGDAKHSLPYLTGEWSESFGRPCMPFDAILLGSRMMVSKEASTSIEVKQMLVKTPGVKRQESWEKSYTGIAGGVITVKSELGEPIHKIHNRATALWRRLDTQFFSLKPEQRGPAIKANKDSIIAALNSDFQKPFFGRKGRGDNSQVAELWQMTYEEVAFRMAELMYVQPESERDDDRHENFHPEGRWVDPTFQSRLLKFLRRTMERFPPTNVETDKGPVEVSSSAISRRPAVLLKRFFVERPQACAHQLHSEDVDFFLHMCKFGGKPVNFIPVVDGELIYWFKKDSLWYSEDLAAVTGRDPQRVVVLQGPVAVKHSVSTTESASDILNGIRDGLVEMLHHQAPQVDRAAEPPNVPEEDDAGDRRAVWNECGLRVSTSADGMVSTYFALPGASRSCTYEEWVDFVTITNPESSTEQRQIDEGAMRHILAGKDNHYYAPTAWVHAALSAVDVVDRGNKWVQSPLRPLFRPPNIIRVQRKAVPQPTDSGDGTDSGTAVPPRLRVASVSVLDAKHQEITPEVMAEAKDFRTLCTLSCVPGADSDSPVELVLSLNYHYSAHHDVAAAPRKQTTLALALHFSLHGKSLCRVRTGENDRIKDFYAALWAPSGMSASSVADESEVEREHVSTFKLTADHLSSLVAALHGPSEAAGTAASTAPMDAFIVAAWEPLVKCLLPKQIDASLLELVHQSNSYRWVLPAGSDKTTRQPIEVDEEIHCTARIKEISNTESGKSVNVEALLSRTSSGGKKVPFAVVESAFLFRGKFTDSQNCFKRFRYSRSIVLHNETEVVILLDKSWISFNDPIKAGAHPPGVYAGAELLFELEVREYGLQGRGANASIAQCNVSGKAYNSRDPTVPIATIDYGAEKIHTNPVINFLDRRRAPGIRPNMFESGGQNMLAVPHETLAPSKGTPYGQSSGDLNPIHVSPQFASLATLPDTIVHGMWTYAAARRVVEKAVVRGQQQNLRSFSMDFVGMVMPGSKLYTQVKHVGMKDYSKVLEVTTVNSEGSVVLKGRAQTELEHTVYVFTGQGSAEKDMGMDLYRSSAVAKDIWDRADEHLLETYGFSILNIVRQNPTRLPLFFGGKRGQQVRANYRSLTCRDPVTGMRAQLIPEIGAYTDSFQFLNPQGLLFATQFTQPALVLTELAAFCDMREKGLVEKCGFSFAGHSLGEYAALSAACDILGLKSLVELVFLRGLTMQRAVPRDRLGRSDFGMVAASPTRIMKNFTEENLHELVNSISRQSKKLLQVVNYNVEGSQYVVAGHLVCLSALTEVCTALHLDRSRTLIKDLEGLVSRKLALAEKLQAEKKAVGGILTMKRGKATIPLAGIDVPFHSRYLASGVETFRFTMMQKITESRMTKERLQLMLGHYIPNVTAKPFSLSYEYVCLSHEMTGSKVLEALMPAVDDPEAEAKWTALTEKQPTQF